MKTKLLFVSVSLFLSVTFVNAGSNIILYDNASVLFPNTGNSWPGTGSVDFLSTDAPYAGTNCIKWVVGGSYTDWSLQAWATQDLSAQTSSNFEYYYKTTYSGAVWLKWQFTSNIGVAPWTQSTFTFTTQNDWISDGAWHKTSIPLASFAGDVTFSWTQVEKFRITSDWDGSLAGKIFYFDEIKLVPQTATGVNEVTNNQLSVFVSGNGVQINSGSVAGNVVIYNMQGQTVKNLGYLNANSKTTWNKKNDSDNQLPAGIYLCRIQNSKQASKFIIK
jgi:hypothetical protein